MKIHIVDNAVYFPNSEEKKTLKNQVKTILKSLSLPGNTELCITFTHDDVMRSLNSTYRGINKTTDVLSFSQFECNLPDFNTAIANKKNRTILLGDIIISIDTTKKNAERFGTSTENEIKKLIVHGILHLIGYDHKKASERKTMRAKEKELLKVIQTKETDP